MVYPIENHLFDEKCPPAQVIQKSDDKILKYFSIFPILRDLLGQVKIDFRRSRIHSHASTSLSLRMISYSSVKLMRAKSGRIFIGAPKKLPTTED